MTEKTIRREDARLLTGSGRYTADWNLPGQLPVSRRASSRRMVFSVMDCILKLIDRKSVV